MKLSLETVCLLDSVDCPEAKSAVDSMIDQSFEHFVNSPNNNKKLYFNFQTVNGKIFLETETRSK